MLIVWGTLSHAEWLNGRIGKLVGRDSADFLLAPFLLFLRVGAHTLTFIYSQTVSMLTSVIG